MSPRSLSPLTSARASRRARRRVLPWVVLPLIMALALSGCSLFGGSDDTPSGAQETAEAQQGPTAWVEAPREEVAAGGTLRLAVTTEPATFNPLLTTAAGTDLPRLLGPTTGSAVRPTADGSFEVDPDYATSVEQTGDDPLTIRVELNEAAVWQDGSPITSADMRSFVAVMTDADAQVASREGWDAIAEVRADGDFAYEVEFERPRSDWPSFVYPRVPESISSDVGAFNDDYTDRALPSNGPFVVAGIDEETGTITQEPNPRWWGEAPRLESVEWRIATAQTQAEAFADDGLDVATLDESGVEAVDEERVQRASGSDWSHITLNAGRGALRDEQVRRAVALALDRQALAAQVAEPLGAEPRVVDSLLRVPGQAGYDAVAEPLDRDVDAAIDQLEEAGYEVDGEQPQATLDGEPLTLSLVIVADGGQVSRRAEAVREQLAEAGITVEIREVAAEDYVADVLVPLDFDLLTFSWPAALYGPAGIEPRFRPITSTQNFTGSSMSRDPWRALGAAADDDAAARLQETLRERAVMVPLALVPRVVAVREGVVNVGASSFETPDWTRVGFRAEE